MKSELKAKFLQHLASKKRDGGFTLIELLVVIIIIGILAAIALPSFLNQANKAKESEAKQYVGTGNRSQQAYYLENSHFATDMSRLELGVNTGTTNYNYKISTADKQKAIMFGESQNTVSLRSFVGGVAASVASTGEGTTKAVLCRAIKPATAAADAGVTLPDATSNVDPTCGNDFEKEGK